LESSIDEVVDSIKQVFNKLTEVFPNSTIYYLSTTPVINIEHKLYKKQYVAGRTNQENMDINQGVKLLCNNDQLIFVDQFNGLIDENGFLKEEFTADGIHLNKNGYKVYASKIIEI